MQLDVTGHGTLSMTRHQWGELVLAGWASLHNPPGGDLGQIGSMSLLNIERLGQGEAGDGS